MRLPPELRDTRHLSEAKRYDLMSATIPDFILSRENPLSWQNEIRFSYIEKHIGELDGAQILDLGCGWGLLSNQMVQRGAQVIGVDISGGALNLARAEAVKLGLKTGFIKSRAERIPCNDGCFDIATSTDVLEHVENIDRLVSEVSRILKPGGLFFFVTVNKTLLARLVYITFGEIVLRLLPRGTHRHDQFVAPADLGRSMAEYGLIIEDIQGILVNPLLKRYHYWPSLAIEYIGVARKRA
jgi:2-polyprenyl-6-hydroxyphenyl methylase/3-demethylubiquinone-9 3-methyltransferase